MNREDVEFYGKELQRNKDSFIKLIDDIVEVIEKDGLPYNSKTSMININNSTGVAVSAHNTGSTTQSVLLNITEVEEYYNRAISEVDNSVYSDGDKSEIKDMLSDILECLQRQQQPGKSLTRLIAKYSNQALSIGANFAAILGYINVLK